MDSFEIKKGLFGRRSVRYGCPRCNAALTSSLEDAGKPDTCPECGARFIVPGAEERDRIRSEEAAAAKERSEQKKLARRQREVRQEEERRRQQEADRRAAAAAPQPPQVEERPAAPVPPNDDAIRCPKCGSIQIAANKKGFGLGKAAVGGILLGPVGLLGGMIGSGKIKITCLKCGHVFEPGQG